MVGSFGRVSMWQPAYWDAVGPSSQTSLGDSRRGGCRFRFPADQTYVNVTGLEVPPVVVIVTGTGPGVGRLGTVA